MKTLLDQLPAPPQNKKGWPWTVESPLMPASIMQNGEPWPKISIVTPSFNQGQFIEETIRSVLLQNYPNLEYVIIDGGSTDNSVEIIKKYEPWLTYWVSEKDRGQSHAINKGFERCTGDIFNWLCSDDIFLQEALKQVATEIELAKPCWLAGRGYFIDEKPNSVKKAIDKNEINLNTFLFWKTRHIPQPSIFWNSKLYNGSFKINEDLHYCMDIDLWFNFYKKSTPIISDYFFSRLRHHSNAKTTGYGSQYKDFMNEYSKWTLENVYQSIDKKTVEELLESILWMQEEFSKMRRLRNHIVIGKIALIWKKLINPNLPI